MNDKKNFLDAVNEAPYLTNDLEFQIAAKEYIRGHRMPIVDVGWDTMIGGFGLLWQQITGIGGYANYGKGTLARQMMLQIALKQNVNCAVWCPEDMPIEYAYFDLVSTYSGLNTEDKTAYDFIGEKRGLEYLEKMREMFYIIDSSKWQENSLEELLAVFERLYYENNCRLFLIDPYKDLAQDSMVRDDFRVHDDILKMRKFVQKHNAHLFVVLHLKRPSTKSGENPPVPTYNDLHYGSEWSKSLDNMLFYHHPTFFTDRLNTSRMLSVAKCKKRKIQGNGSEYEMTWNFYKNRILDNNGECTLPAAMPNVKLETSVNGLPTNSIKKAHETATEDLMPIAKLPF